MTGYSSKTRWCSRTLSLVTLNAASKMDVTITSHSRVMNLWDDFSQTLAKCSLVLDSFEPQIKIETSDFPNIFTVLFETATLELSLKLLSVFAPYDLSILFTASKPPAIPEEMLNSKPSNKHIKV